MEYIHHYTFTTGHMRKSYSNEIEKEIRIRVRELIKFERGISCNYTVPFMDGTKLHIVADGSFYSATVMIEAKGEDIVLLTTVGCKDETGLSFAMRAINDAQKDLTGKELVGCHPKLPFIMDILTPFCFVIADWSGDFCRTLAWSIFDDSLFFLFFYIISDNLQKESEILYVENFSHKISHIYHIETKRKIINTMFSRHQKGYNHMAFTVTQRVISSEDTIYSYCDNLCKKAKLLYNAALFRVRNVFTRYEKEYRAENEIGVFLVFLRSRINVRILLKSLRE